MKQQFFVTALALILGMAGKAQHSEPMVVKVAYKFIHIIDKQKPDTLHNEELVLRIGKTSSAYNNYPFSVAIKPREAVAAPPAGGATRAVVGMPMAVVNDWGLTTALMEQKFTDKKLTRYESVSLSKYEIEEKLPVIKWDIQTATKTIGGYTCQQASGLFGGRKYTAWFTTDLPFTTGPWKLNGLPGVILEAYDDKAEVFFIFKYISEAEEGELTVYPPDKPALKVTESVLKKAKDAYENDPGGITQAQAGVSGTIAVRFRDRKNKFHSGEAADKLMEEKKKNAKVVLTNPLELKP